MLQTIKRSIYKRKCELENKIAWMTDHLRNYLNPMVFERIQSIAQKAFLFESSYTSNRLTEKFYFLKGKQFKSSSLVQRARVSPRSLVANTRSHDGEDECFGKGFPNNEADGNENVDLISNLSNAQLTMEEVDLLSKGPNFSIVTFPKDRTVLLDEYRVGFQRLLHNVRWHQQILRQERMVNTTGPCLYPPHKEINLPSLIPEVEEVVKNVTHRYLHVLRDIESMKLRSNLSSVDWKTIKSLRTKNVVIDSSDKGGDFSITDKTAYHNAMNAELNGSGKFRRVAFVKIEKVENRVNTFWRELCHKHKIDKRTESHYLSSNSNFGNISGLVKTHKVTADGSLKLRLVMNTANTPGYRLSWLISRSIAPDILKSTSSKSSEDIIQSIKGLDPSILRTMNYPFSLDIVDMYHKIPRKDAIQCLVDRLTNSRFNLLGIVPIEIGCLIDVILRSNQFVYGSSLYIQATGLPIGNRLSGFLADVFISDLQMRVIEQFPSNPCYRYVDDYLILTESEQTASEIHQAFNAADERIKFEFELPKMDRSLSLLDFTIKIDDGYPRFTFHQKQCRKPTFVHGSSGIPKSSMMNIIDNERARIESRCTEESDRVACVRRFQMALGARGHTLHIKKPRRNNTKKGDKKFFLNIPFISDKINSKIKKSLAPFGLNFCISHKSKRLKNLLREKSNLNLACNFQKCSLNNQDCMKTHVVYKMVCTGCGSFYVGSTWRRLHQRVREHLTQRCSLVYQHNVVCNSDWRTSVLYQCQHLQQLRFMEAMAIRKLTPTLNGKDNLFDSHIVF
jgi:hypothetical protein